jgi:hypothetical protein
MTFTSRTKYFFRSLNGALKPRKKGTFFTLKKKGGGAHATIAPSGSAALVKTRRSYKVPNFSNLPRVEELQPMTRQDQSHGILFVNRQHTI